jgi:hypothetical protein
MLIKRTVLFARAKLLRVFKGRNCNLSVSRDDFPKLRIAAQLILSRGDRGPHGWRHRRFRKSDRQCVIERDAEAVEHTAALMVTRVDVAQMAVQVGGYAARIIGEHDGCRDGRADGFEVSH